MSQKGRGYCLLPDILFLRSRDHAKKVEEDIVTTTDNVFLRPPPYKLGHIPATKCLLLLTHPYSSILPSIFFTCLSSNHIFTYTRPHIYPNNLPNPNITSLTSSFNSSQLPASHTSTTSSQISFNLNPNSPFSFLKHPQDFISILLFFQYTVSPFVPHNLFQFLFQIVGNPKPRKKPLDIGNQEMSDELRNRL